MQRRAKRPAGAPSPALARDVTKVGIVGAGLMAGQIAALVLRRLEVPIAIRDVSDEALAAARESIEEELSEQVAKGRYDEGKARFLGSLVHGTTDTADFGGCDLVLEAIFEEMSLKKQVLAELEDVVSSECLLVTNTSALSVTEMGSDLRHPERVVGMHFFNPVAVLPLVELVRTDETDDVTLATAWAVTKKLKKRGVLTRPIGNVIVLMPPYCTTPAQMKKMVTAVRESIESAF